MTTKHPEEWTDQEVYYWVFEINVGQQHAVALWNAEVNGQTLLSLKKSDLNEHCKSLNKDTTQKLWQEIKKLHTNSRRSIFSKPGKPSPITRDYPDDSDDFSSDDGDDDLDFNNSSQASLPDLLKARLKEFQAQQHHQHEEEGNENMEDEYIVPEGDTTVEEPQDDYEEFDAGDHHELYLTPPNEPAHGNDAPPPVPSRMPLSPGAESNSHTAPSLPPRPGAPSSSSSSIPRFQPAAPTIDSEEEEYVVPASQSDPRQPHQQQRIEEDDFYEPPKDNDMQDDFGGDYVTPNQLPASHMKLDGSKSPMNTRMGLPKPKPPLPIKSTPLPIKSTPSGKVSDMGKRPPALLPSTNNNIKFISSNHSPQHGFSSLRDRFAEKKPVQPQIGGSLHQIKHELNQLKPPAPRPMSTIPKHSTPYRPSSPKLPHQPEPVKPTMLKPTMLKPAMPKPRQSTDKNDMSDCDWFRENLSREVATSALLNHRLDGTFVVRPSTRKADYPYTLQLLFKGRIKNLPIGLRIDRKYALGAPKDGETRFESVRELIEYHRRQEVVLANSEGKTCLVEPVPLP